MQEITNIFKAVLKDARSVLLEHEVYEILNTIDIKTPAHVFIPYGHQAASKLNCTSKEVVVKIVSPDILHKTDVGGVMFCNNDLVEINKCMVHINNAISSASIRGYIVVEKIDYSPEMGQEIIVSSRNTADFGTILGFGLGGLDTELYGKNMDNAFTVVSGDIPVSMSESILNNIAYKKITGKVRGSKKLLSDDSIVDTLEKLRQLCNEFPEISECEINPMVAFNKNLVAIDGLIKLGMISKEASKKPIKKIELLFQPQSIAIVGVSAKTQNMGSVILDNILERGFEKNKLYIVKENTDNIKGITCYAGVTDLPIKVSVFIVAVSAKSSVDIIKEIINNDRAENIILIPGGFAETQYGKELETQIQDSLAFSRKLPSQGPLIVGGNCLGVMSFVGKYDTFFIPKQRMEYSQPYPYAFISQSGAFVVSKISKTLLTPLYAVSIGNQIDLVISDYLNYFVNKNDIKCIAMYIEGFKPLDALKSAKLIRELRKKNKQVLIYKAGRTQYGQTATSSHTASISSDYDVFKSIMTEAGAKVVDSVEEFEDQIKLMVLLSGFSISGKKIGFVGNAGFEAVLMADGFNQEIMPSINENTKAAINQLFEENGLSGLISASNPLDITPAANDILYIKALLIMLSDPSIDVVVLSCIPMTPSLKSPDEEASLFNLLTQLWKQTKKPFVVVVDSGHLYDSACLALKDIPVFRETDRAVKALKSYLQ